mgnify:CR=1 FL=1
MSSAIEKTVTLGTDHDADKAAKLKGLYANHVERKKKRQQEAGSSLDPFHAKEKPEKGLFEVKFRFRQGFLTVHAVSR